MITISRTNDRVRITGTSSSANLSGKGELDIGFPVHQFHHHRRDGLLVIRTDSALYETKDLQQTDNFRGWLEIPLTDIDGTTGTAINRYNQVLNILDFPPEPNVQTNNPIIGSGSDANRVRLQPGNNNDYLQTQGGVADWFPLTVNVGRGLQGNGRAGSPVQFPAGTVDGQGLVWDDTTQTYIPDPNFTPPFFSTALNGIDEAISYLDHPELNWNQADGLTLVAWVKRIGDTGPNDAIVAKERLYELSWESNSFLLSLNTINNTLVQISSINTYPDDTWIQVTAVYDPFNNELRLYIDGLLANSILTTDAFITSHASELNVGADLFNNSGFSSSIIHQIAKFDTPFDLTDALEVYNGGVTTDLTQHSKAADLSFYMALDSSTDLQPFNGVPNLAPSGVRGTGVNINNADNLRFDVPA